MRITKELGTIAMALALVCSATTAKAYTVYANYYFIGDSDTATQNDDGNVINPRARQSVSKNEEVKFTATAPDGSKITKWGYSGADSQRYSDYEWGEDSSSLTYTYKVGTADAHISARFDYIPFGVDFKENGGSGKMDSLSGMVITNAFNLPECTFTRGGYNFNGWKCKDCTKTFTDEQSVTGEDFWDSTNKKFHETLVAQWKKASYTITIDANGCTGGSVAPAEYQISDAKQTATITPPTREGYKLSSWTVSGANGGSPTVEGNTLTIPAGTYGNLTLKVKSWELNSYTITYNFNGGYGGSYSPTSGKVASSVYVSNPTWGDESHTFAGWLLEGDDADYANAMWGTGPSGIVNPISDSKTTFPVPVGSGVYLRDLTLKQGGKVTLSAQWNKAPGQTYAIYTAVAPTNTAGSANGGDEYEENTEVTLTATANTGYSFAYWQKGESQVSTSSNYQFTVTAESAGTYTAVFTGNVYKVTYKTDGGEPKDPSTNVIYGCEYGKLPIVHQSGYELIGWYTDSDGDGDRITEKSVVTNAANHKLWAYWVEKPCPAKALDCTDLEFTIDGSGWRTVDDATATNGTCLKITDDTWDSGNKVYATLPTNGVLRFNYKGGTGSQVYVNLGKEQTSYTFTCAQADTWYTGEITNDVGQVAVIFSCPEASLWDDFSLDYVVWTPKQNQQYTLSFDIGDNVKSVAYRIGEGEMQSTSESCKLVLDEGTGWWARATAADGYEIAGEAELCGTIAGDTNIVFTASEKGKYVIAYKPGAGVEGQECAQTNFTEVATNLLGVTYLVTGKGQSGWAKSEGGQKEYELGAQYAGGESITLYPSWTNNQYEVAFITNGVTLTVKTVSFNEAYGELPNPVAAAGERFDGWYTDSDVKITHASIVAIADDHNLTAKFVRDCGGISEVLDCTNLVFATNGNCAVTTEFYHKGGSCVVVTGSAAYNYLTTSNAATGKLSFYLRGIDSTSTKVKVMTNNVQLATSEKLKEGDWIPMSVDIKAYPVEIKIAISVGNRFAIDDVTWTPDAEHPVPQPGDEAEITQAKVKDGKFEIGFTSDERFDYLLMTNGNLSVKSWGEKDRIVGDGNETNFTPVIDKAQPCLFYRVDTIQRQ